MARIVKIVSILVCAVGMTIAFYSESDSFRWIGLFTVLAGMGSFTVGRFMED